MKDAPAPQHTARYRTIGFVLAIVGVLSFSIRPLLVKFAYSYTEDPVTLLALRMVFSLPFFVLAVWWVKRGKPAAPISTRDRWAIIGLGVIGYYAASFFDYLSLQYISSGLSRLIHFMYPTIVVLLSWIFLRRPPRSVEITALLLTYAGMTLMLMHSVAGQHDFLALGAVLAFGSATSYAVYLFAGSQVIQRVGSMRFVAYALLVSSFCCIAQFFVLRPLSALLIPFPVYGLSIIIAVICTVLPIFVIAEALRRLDANSVAIVGALGPVSAMLLGYLGLDEMMNGYQIVGAMLVLVGVVMVSLKKH
ncbi:MAG TPA: DMT family transporter [Burkholderiales bacterium]|nr:DMT family transporter [Burkholderiales bacterium]